MRRSKKVFIGYKSAKGKSNKFSERNRDLSKNKERSKNKNCT